MLPCIHPGCLPLAMSQASLLPLRTWPVCHMPTSRAVETWWGSQPPGALAFSPAAAAAGADGVRSTCLIPNHSVLPSEQTYSEPWALCSFRPRVGGGRLSE